MTAKQYNFTKQNDVVMKARKRFTKQNGVVKQILAGWTKRNGVVEQVYSLNRVSQAITFVGITDAWDYKPVFATIDAVYAVKSNGNNAFKISNYWDVPVITEMEYNGLTNYADSMFFNYANGIAADQSFLKSKSNYQYVREVNISDFSYVSYLVNGYVSKVSLKLADKLYLMPFGDSAYYEVNAATNSVQTIYWDNPLPVNMSNNALYGAITLSDGYGVMAQKNGTALCIISYNNGAVASYQTTLDYNYAMGSTYTPNGQDVIFDLPHYYRAGEIVRFNPVSGAIDIWATQGIGGVVGAYGGYVYYARSSTDQSIAFYVDKYNISGQIVSTLAVPLPAGVAHPGTITTDYDYATKHSGRFAALVISSTHQVVFDLAKI